MAKGKSKRILVGMVSDDSNHRTYYTTRNTVNTQERLKLRKYDPKLRKHVTYTETKKNLGRNEVKARKS